MFSDICAWYSICHPLVIISIYKRIATITAMVFQRTTELCPLFIVSEDYEGYKSIKFIDIKFYPSKAIEQQLYSYKYTWYWRKTNFHDGVIVTSKTEFNIRKQRSLLTNKKVPRWKVRCLKNEWFYSSAGHYRYSDNRTLAIMIDLLVVYFNLCFLNL